MDALIAAGGSGQFSVNGQRDNANYFTVDGVSANAGNCVKLPSCLVLSQKRRQIK
jgi:hypothetical protein